jgi:hypothetical protein
VRVFSPRKERQKKKRSREGEEKKIERERNSLSLPNNTRCPPKRTFVCFASSSSPPISMCSGGTLSLRARILLSIIHSLSLLLYVYSAALFFRFLKLFSYKKLRGVCGTKFELSLFTRETQRSVVVVVVAFTFCFLLSHKLSLLARA